MIENLGGDFTITDRETASTKYNEGAVVSVEQAGESVEKGSTITIIVSKGPGPGTSEEPDSGDGNGAGQSGTGTTTPQQVYKD